MAITDYQLTDRYLKDEGRVFLTGVQALTQDIREDDAKGRHTTTSRDLARTRFGGWLIDTPGMRELQLTDAASGISDVFAEFVQHEHFVGG